MENTIIAIYNFVWARYDLSSEDKIAYHGFFCVAYNYLCCPHKKFAVYTALIQRIARLLALLFPMLAE